MKTKNITLIILITALALCFCLAGFSGCAGDKEHNMTVIVDTNTKYQTIKGFGASACWNFQVLGLEDDATVEKAMEMLYGKTGLNMNIVRYNVGGGSKELGSFGGSNTATTETFFIKERFNGDFAAFSDPDNYDFTRECCRAILKRESLSDCFDDVIYADECGGGKADEKFFDYMLARLNCTADEAVFYEDMYYSAATAHKKGIKVVGLDNRKFVKVGYDKRMEDIAQRIITDYDKELRYYL